jgi:hypothetical protein
MSDYLVVTLTKTAKARVEGRDDNNSSTLSGTSSNSESVNSQDTDEQSALGRPRQ